MTMLVEQKVAAAAWPRGTGSAVSSSDRLEIAYLKFTNDEPIAQGTTQFNFIFAHGTGMNKSIWRVHIEQLFRQSQAASWSIGVVISVDAAGHGDLGVLNKNKLSWAYDWRDGAKDLIHVVKHEVDTTGDFAPDAYKRNILVGHSMGGYNVTYAAALEPSLFDSCIAVEPVIHIVPGMHHQFLLRLRKLENILVDEFPSQEAAHVYFKQKSFYRTLDPRVLDEFIADELFEENGIYRTKASTRAQMSVYLAGAFFIPYGMAALSQLQVPYLVVTGTDAQWNHPDTLGFIQRQVPEHLFDHEALKGDHLAHAQNVLDTVDLIMAYTGKRARFLDENRASFPEVRFKGRPQQMVDEMFRFVRAGDEANAYWYDRPKPKPHSKLKM